MSLISASALQKGDALARQFREAQPFRHVVVDAFLDRTFHQSILDEFPRFEDRFALNEMGDVDGKAVRMGVRELSTTYRELDAFLQTPEFLGYVSTANALHPSGRAAQISLRTRRHDSDQIGIFTRAATEARTAGACGSRRYNGCGALQR